MINVSNYTSKDNPPPGAYGGLADPRVRGGRGYGRRTAVRDRIGPRGPSLRGIAAALALVAAVALDWLAYFVRRRGDRWFAITDTEAYWWGWQITKTLGGLGRRYRDIRFDTLAACARCAGAGVRAGGPCGPCLGTGRITAGAVS